MTKKHLKTLTVPKTWPVKRKESVFTLRPKPGKDFDFSMPLALVFKNQLKYCKTLKEVKVILYDKEVLVDQKRRKDHKYPVGLFDSISIPVSNEHYRMIINKHNTLSLVAIDEKEAKLKLCKVTGKKVLGKDKVQLNLFDGRNITVKEDKYKTGDSVLIELPEQKIKDSFSMDKGNYVLMIGGSHTGESGVIENIDGHMLTIKTNDGKFETPRKSVYVLGKKESSLKIE